MSIESKFETALYEALCEPKWAEIIGAFCDWATGVKVPTPDVYRDKDYARCEARGVILGTEAIIKASFASVRTREIRNAAESAALEAVAEFYAEKLWDLIDQIGGDHE